MHLMLELEQFFLRCQSEITVHIHAPSYQINYHWQKATTKLETELLAVKIALDEWRYCLEGAGLRLIHKNLGYLQTA